MPLYHWEKNNPRKSIPCTWTGTKWYRKQLSRYCVRKVKDPQQIVINGSKWYSKAQQISISISERGPTSLLHRSLNIEEHRLPRVTKSHL